MSYADMLPELVSICRDAGDLILTYYDGNVKVDEKADGSPVTAADQAAEALITPRLLALAPDIPVVAEEAVSQGHVPDISGGKFWLVDPLDGTKEFIKRNGDFTVNIGLIVDKKPVLGVVLRPVSGVAWAGVVGGAAYEEDKDGKQTPISVRQPDDDGVILVASRSHRSPELEAFIDKLPNVKDSISRGSSLKICLIANGDADIYPRVGPTMEWDTAAGHAVLLAAGGKFTDMDGGAFLYAKPDFRNGYFIAESGNL